MRILQICKYCENDKMLELHLRFKFISYSISLKYRKYKKKLWSLFNMFKCNKLGDKNLTVFEIYDSSA